MGTRETVVGVSKERKQLSIRRATQRKFLDHRQSCTVGIAVNLVADSYGKEPLARGKGQHFSFVGINSTFQVMEITCLNKGPQGCEGHAWTYFSWLTQIPSFEHPQFLNLFNTQNEEALIILPSHPLESIGHNVIKGTPSWALCWVLSCSDRGWWALFTARSRSEGTVGSPRGSRWKAVALHLQRKSPAGWFLGRCLI